MGDVWPKWTCQSVHEDRKCWVLNSWTQSHGWWRRKFKGSPPPVLCAYPPIHSWLFQEDKKWRVANQSLWSLDLFLLKQNQEYSFWLSGRICFLPILPSFPVFILFLFWCLDVDHSQRKPGLTSSYPVSRYSMLLSKVTSFPIADFDLHFNLRSIIIHSCLKYSINIWVTD